MPSPPRPVPPRLPTIEPLGDSALRIVLGDSLDPVVNQHACALADRIAAAAAAGHLPGVTDVLPVFTGVGVHYSAEAVPSDDAASPFAALVRRLEPLLPEPGGRLRRAAPRLVEIPVCYGGAHGPDLAQAADACGVSPQELTRLHQQPAEEQQVYMLGFAPGNPYIGRLDATLAIPRRATPRTSLPLGSVCIANRQTVVYPLSAPGGWNMIGRTPLRLFDPRRAEPCLLRPGDRVRFHAIDEAAFERAQAGAAA